MPVARFVVTELSSEILTLVLVGANIEVAFYQFQEILGIC